MSFQLLVEDFFPIIGRGYIFDGLSQGRVWIGDILTLDDTEMEWQVKGTEIFAHLVRDNALRNIGVLLDIGGLAPTSNGKKALES